MIFYTMIPLIILHIKILRYTYQKINTLQDILLASPKSSQSHIDFLNIETPILIHSNNLL